jgi:hypothetical protein
MDKKSDFVKYLALFYNYSYLNDSTGSKLAAFLAGKKPATNPIPTSRPMQLNKIGMETCGLPK